MDDVRPPRRPATPMGSGPDLTGVPPRRPVAPGAASTPGSTAASVNTGNSSEPAAQPPASAADPVPRPAQIPVKPEVPTAVPASSDAPTLSDLNLDKPTDIDAALEGRPVQVPEPTPPPAAAPSSGAGTEPADGKPLDLPVANEPAINSSSSLLAEIEAQEKAESESRVEPAPTAPPPRKSKWPAIIIAIIFALALIGGAGYAYWQNSKQTAKTTNTQNEESGKEKEPAKNPATVEDVDKAANAIQESIDKIDEDSQLQESELSDENLGL